MKALRWLLLAICVAASAQPSRAEVGTAGVWVGRYVCGQGETGLTLAIESGDNGTIRARFIFYPVGGNPDVPEGCFAMSGTFDGNNRDVDLIAQGWIVRPKGYVTVNLTGRVSEDGTQMRGNVDGPRCTTFSLRRSTTDTIPGARICRSPDVAQSKEQKR